MVIWVYLDLEVFWMGVLFDSAMCAVPRQHFSRPSLTVPTSSHFVALLSFQDLCLSKIDSNHQHLTLKVINFSCSSSLRPFLKILLSFSVVKIFNLLERDCLQPCFFNELKISKRSYNKNYSLHLIYKYNRLQKVL